MQAARKKSVWRLMAGDVRRTYDYLDGGRLKRVAACALSPGVHAAIVYRLGHSALGLPRAARLVADPLYFVAHFAIRLAWGIDIPRHASIGPGLYIGHFGGIILSPQTVIGANCDLSHDVTIGVAGRGSARGVPTIGDNVYIAPGAKIFGRIRVGNNVKIGANAVIHADVPDNALAVAASFSIVSRRPEKFAA